MPKVSSLLIIATCLGGYAFGLALRHDIDEAEYIKFGETFPAVVEIGGLASGALVAPDWVLTVAHAPEMLELMRPDAALTVKIGGTTHNVARVVVPEEPASGREHHDIALLQLEEPVPDEVAPLAVWKEELKVGTKFALVGLGILAVGDQGIKVSREAMTAPPRRLRGGWNEIERRDDKVSLLFADFDAPEEGVELEAGPCVGDSGGPALIRVKGEGDEPDTWHIAGVMALVDDTDEDGVIGEYGDEFGMTSTFAYAEWIEETMDS